MSSELLRREVETALDRASNWVEMEASLKSLLRGIRSPSTPDFLDLVPRAEATFLRLVQETGEIRLGAGFALAPLLELTGRAQQRNWKALQAVFSNRPPDYLTSFVLLVIEASMADRDWALANFVDRCAASTAPLSGELAAEAGSMLLATNWFAGNQPSFRASLARLCKALLSRPRPASEALTFLTLLGFDKNAPLEHLSALFNTIALPTMLAAFEHRDFDDALYLEWLIYLNYVAKVDTELHFTTVVGQWTEQAAAAGRVAARDFPPLQWPAIVKVPRIAFILHSADFLGHTDALFSFLRGLAHLEPQPIEALVYVLGKSTDELKRQCLDAGVVLVSLKDLAPQDSAFKRLLNLRQRLADDGITAAVFVSVAYQMAFAFGLGLAPVQVWWSMKYHGLRLREIDGYLALGSFERTKQYEGDSMPWRAVHRTFGALYDPSLTEAASKVRAGIAAPQDLILGCIGREEKLASPAYIDALARILRLVPNAVFVWTGRSRMPEVEALFREHGIAERTRFVGWINSRLYAQVLDMFVDSFPFLSGLTAFEAMAAGNPVIGLLTREAMETGWPTHIVPVFRGEAGSIEEQTDVRSLFSDPNLGNLLTVVQTPDEYVALAVRLAREPLYRARCGSAMKEFVARYMTNEAMMGSTGANHLLEIIDNKRWKRPTSSPSSS